MTDLSDIEIQTINNINYIRKDDTWYWFTDGDSKLHEIAKYGTSEGASAAWDTRGRDQKDPKTSSHPVVNGDTKGQGKYYKAYDAKGVASISPEDAKSMSTENLKAHIDAHTKAVAENASVKDSRYQKLASAYKSNLQTLSNEHASRQAPQKSENPYKNAVGNPEAPKTDKSKTGFHSMFGGKIL